MASLTWLLGAVAVTCAVAVSVLVWHPHGADAPRPHQALLARLVLLEDRVHQLEKEIGTKYINAYVNVAQEQEQLARALATLRQRQDDLEALTHHDTETTAPG